MIDINVIDSLNVPDIDPDLLMNRMVTGLMIAGELVKAAWIDRALVMGLRNTGESSYVGGIQSKGEIRVTTAQVIGDTITVVVEVVNTSPHAAIVENGHVAFHLPSKIHWPTAATKFTKDGRMYLHIPFRHFAYADEDQQKKKGYTRSAIKQMMPESVYRDAKRLAFTSRMNQGPITDSLGRFAARDHYVSKPKDGQQKRLPEKMEYYWKPSWESSKYAGMMKTGVAKHAQYLTIRTLTQDSPKWNIPAKSGKHIAAQVATVVPGRVQAVLNEALAGFLRF